VHLTFLTPLGALLCLGALLPLAALALNERQAGRARRVLGLAAPELRSRVATAAALASIPILLGLALAQPVLVSTVTQHVRTDAQVYYVFDTSISMRASAGPRAATRLDRARIAGAKMRQALSVVPAGVATMTDRVLPNVFPTADEEVFAAALAETVGIERPPPKGFNDTATTFAALDTFVGNNFFTPGIPNRVVVLLTDGETAPYYPGDLHNALRPRPRTHFVVVRFWHRGERIYLGGRADPGYKPDARSAQAVRTLVSAIGGRAFEENDLGGAIAAARAYAGNGPLEPVGRGLRVITLARWLALAALVPLAFLLWRRNVV
jgi:hypothetical protein